jgi:competence protein ComEA
MDLPQFPTGELPVIGFIKANKLPLLLASGSILCIVISLILLVKSTQTLEEIEFDGGVVEGESTIGQIKADVAGEVAKPGVYSLPADARIEDAITAAGGFTANADMNYVTRKINRAQRVVDGGKVYIPTDPNTITSHNQSYATSGEGSEPVSHTFSSVVTTSGGLSQNGAGVNIVTDSSTDNGNLISINDATISQLDTLPGVGPVTAQKIIDNRPYQNLEELLTRKAVGKSVYTKIIEMISL